MSPMRVLVYVRANSPTVGAGGEYDGALVVRVREPARSGRATEAALRSLAASIGVPRERLRLRTGATSRRKIIEVDAEDGDVDRVHRVLDALRSAPPA